MGGSRGGRSRGERRAGGRSGGRRGQRGGADERRAEEDERVGRARDVGWRRARRRVVCCCSSCCVGGGVGRGRGGRRRRGRRGGRGGRLGGGRGRRGQRGPALVRRAPHRCRRGLGLDEEARLHVRVVVHPEVVREGECGRGVRIIRRRRGRGRRRVGGRRKGSGGCGCRRGGGGLEGGGGEGGGECDAVRAGRGRRDGVRPHEVRAVGAAAARAAGAFGGHRSVQELLQVPKFFFFKSSQVKFKRGVAGASRKEEKE
ncbi:hypothetical protein B0H15DRAFT_852694 [Mycena belliarum]|uniref:Uncharacterized protein n=1 Tax=Mycena belliarum TaxID=1033014 RepID=A0AAD6XL76_9AGAR|nr:hypothetical protein B0H15DRAFT_852694 [Mycena belliae]